MAEPRKAYLVTFKIVNEAEAIVYADNAKDAIERFRQGEGTPAVTHVDYRHGQPKAKRWPSEDLE
jgi:hypothetical protein